MPKFSVGEQVVLVSKSLPQFNGIHTVEEVVDECRRNLDGEWEPCGYYLLHLDPAWAESALRKLPPKSDYSFDELMANLKVADKDFLEVATANEEKHEIN